MSKAPLSKIDEIRLAAEGSLEAFIRLISPDEAFPHCHSELCTWWTRPEAKNFQLLLYPRDHGKSRFVAYRVCWEITKNPAVRVLYLSGTTSLALEQIRFIKGILESPIYRK
jgi:hypothetical protein